MIVARFGGNRTRLTGRLTFHFWGPTVRDAVANCLRPNVSSLSRSDGKGDREAVEGLVPQGSGSEAANPPVSSTAPPRHLPRQGRRSAVCG